MSSEEKAISLSGRAYIQRFLQSPWSPLAVLSFMFGVNFDDEEELEHGLRQGNAVLEMGELWFCGHCPAFDELGQPFGELVHAAGRAELVGPEWNATVDGLMAQLLLCDQLSRSIFRGSQQAFAYDSRALALARTLSASLLGDSSELGGALSGEFYPPYLIFVLTAFMHSERGEDHALLGRVHDHAEVHAPPLLHEWFELMRSGSEAHTMVIDRFGRYPHRNVALGRSNTPEEEAWLADVDNLPGWAKSQLLPES